MNSKTGFAFLVLISVSLLLVGCGNKGCDPKPTAAELTAAGWAELEDGDYDGAIADLNSAIETDPSYSEAYCGLGWCYAMLSDDSLAVENFQRCLTFTNPDSVTLDARAGLAYAYQAQGRYDEAIDEANQVLAADASWTFSHDSAYSSSDLHLLLAECYYALSDFESSLAEVQILNPGFFVYVNTAVGRGALADEIERLRGIV